KIAAQADKTWTAAPVIGGAARKGDAQNVCDPAHTSRQIGSVIFADKESCGIALHTAQEAFAGWNATPAALRADAIARMADLMEENMAELMALCVREAGKTLPDALA